MKAQKLPCRSQAEAARYFAEHFVPGLHILQIAHDDGCPAMRTQRDADCKPPCKPDFWLISPFADARDN
jgi:hypothetical protein